MIIHPNNDIETTIQEKYSKLHVLADPPRVCSFACRIILILASFVLFVLPLVLYAVLVIDIALEFESTGGHATLLLVLVTVVVH